jgi:hypothetical protein
MRKPFVKLSLEVIKKRRNWKKNKIQNVKLVLKDEMETSTAFYD